MCPTQMMPICTFSLLAQRDRPKRRRWRRIRQAFKKRRCLIPADGFYEWRKTAKPKLPFAIAMKDGRPFTFAALWENWKDPESGEWLPSAIFCVVALQRALNGFSFCAQPGEISATFREKRLNPLLPLLFAKADPYCSS